jgi:hypothetical protein
MRKEHVMAQRVVVLVGTTKGLFLYSSDEHRREWQLDGPYLPGWEIYSALGDRKDARRIVVGTSHMAYGATVRISEDLGATWSQVAAGPSYAPESGFKLNRIWQMVPGHPSEPDTLFAGVDEAGLFVSRDRGATWSELDALTRHSSRPDWFPGAGGLCLHTIVLHPTNPRRMWVGISAVGVFRTDDAGASWQACNTGLSRVPTGQPDPEVGYCIHKMVLDPLDPETLHMQEHTGVFRSTNGGDSWFPIEDGLTVFDDQRPFGFPIAVSPSGDLFLIPLESSELRSMRDGRLLVYRMAPGETCWQPIGDVVPDEPRHVNVLRDALDVDQLSPYGAYFGTTSGEIFCSIDRGEHWSRLPGQLSRILAVKSWVMET